LGERTEYEAWLLEAVYEIAKHKIAASAPDEFIYPPGGASPRTGKYFSSDIAVGDWRGGFLKVGAPLVFVTAFKILDMMIEWVLVENGVAPKRKSYTFAEKAEALKGPLQFPPLVEARPWLRERLCALYDQLKPLRGTIIHDRRFTSANGTLEVSSTKGAAIGLTILITEADLRNLALVLVSLLRCLQGTWALDTFEEKRLRQALDELAHLHGVTVLGQLPPYRLTVRVYVLDEEPIGFDLTRIRTDVGAKFPKEDVVFDVLIVAVARDGAGAKAYLIPWDQLGQVGSTSQQTRAALAGLECAVPDNLDIADAARALSAKQ
jgi:hypothetical protein